MREEVTTIQMEVRDVLFYEEDPITAIWNLGEVAEEVLTSLDIRIIEEHPGDDTVKLIVELENLDRLTDKYNHWEVIDDNLMYIYLEGIICGSDASRIELSWGLLDSANC